jgi:4-aminobutyrate aminotransferase-like enzyme
MSAVLPRRWGARGGRRGAAFGLHAPGGAVQRPLRSTAALTAEIAESVSDLQFTSRYRVPFQFSGYVRRHFKAGAFVASSAGVKITDLDGNELYDLTGSYGVNVFGYDFYKECIERGSERVRDLGPVLGAYHPVTAYNVRRLLEISGLDEISFHMSGTEAVMQAVRLARYHTGAVTWSASAAPTMAGGATCSPASAIRWRPAKPTP